MFTNFIICRLTETTISKSRDIWRQSGESMRLLSWVWCSVLHVIDMKQLLVHCCKVQQFTGSKKYHYCTFSRETDWQYEGNGLNLCSLDAGADFAQHMSCPLLCSDHFFECRFVGFMEYKMGFASKVLPEWILESTITINFIHPSGKLKLSFNHTTKNISQ